RLAPDGASAIATNRLRSYRWLADALRAVRACRRRVSIARSNPLARRLSARRSIAARLRSFSSERAPVQFALSPSRSGAQRTRRIKRAQITKRRRVWFALGFSFD